MNMAFQSGSELQSNPSDARELRNTSFEWYLATFPVFEDYGYLPRVLVRSIIKAEPSLRPLAVTRV